jgi:multidrug efflux pump subunit AcrA (membrane-fusion protein)
MYVILLVSCFVKKFFKSNQSSTQFINYHEENHHFIWANCLISLTSCNSKQEEKEVAETYSVTNPTIDTSFTKNMFLKFGLKNIEIRALEKGSCKKIYVDEGQYVKEGQLLFKILLVL